MRGRLTKLLSIMVIGGMAVGLAACGSETADTSGTASTEAESSDSDAAADTGLEIGIVVKTATNAHFQDMAYGAVLAGYDLGITVRVDNTTTEADVEGQVTKIENMVSAGMDAVILTPNESSGVSNAVMAAYDAGIPFVTVDTTIDNIWGDDWKEYIPNFIGEDYEAVAYDLAKAVCEKMEGEGNVVIIRGVDAASSSIARTAGIERAIAEYDGITVVESQSANYDQDTAVTTVADIIQAHPDVDAVICCSDLMAMGAVTALEENGYDVSPDGTIVAGIDGNVLALQSIADGEMYATAYDYTILQGYLAVEQAYALIQGEEVLEETLVPDVLITKDNVNDHLSHGEEVAAWTMGAQLESVSDDEREYLNEALALMEE
ncbi:MAG: sugar ABC transporter substrate-binding protein [Clostridiales bacterium]|nr:sugar ABC transporter substrate-binding protein [Clostridiales bacterium]